MLNEKDKKDKAQWSLVPSGDQFVPSSDFEEEFKHDTNLKKLDRNARECQAKEDTERNEVLRAQRTSELAERKLENLAKVE